MLFLSLNACAGIELHDDPVCYEFSPERGRCVNYLSGKEFTVDEENKYDGKTWWELRPVLMQIPPKTWANLKILIIKVCKKYKKICDDDVASWDRTIQTIDESMNKKEGPLP